MFKRALASSLNTRLGMDNAFDESDIQTRIYFNFNAGDRFACDSPLAVSNNDNNPRRTD